MFWNTQVVQDAVNIQYSTMLQEGLSEALALKCGLMLVRAIEHLIDTQQAVWDASKNMTEYSDEGERLSNLSILRAL